MLHEDIRESIVSNLCYTELVYGRINKKLNTNFSKQDIETKIFKLIKQDEPEDFKKIGKNYYITNSNELIRITVNSTTFRVITVDKIHNSK